MDALTWVDVRPDTVPGVAAIRLPGAPANGRALGYAAFAVATVALTHAVFFGEDRYHVVATPALCLLAAAALRRSDERAAVDAESAHPSPSALTTTADTSTSTATT